MCVSLEKLIKVVKLKFLGKLMAESPKMLELESSVVLTSNRPRKSSNRHSAKLYCPLAALMASNTRLVV